MAEDTSILPEQVLTNWYLEFGDARVYLLLITEDLYDSGCALVYSISQPPIPLKPDTSQTTQSPASHSHPSPSYLSHYSNHSAKQTHESAPHTPAPHLCCSSSPSAPLSAPRSSHPADCRDPPVLNSAAQKQGRNLRESPPKTGGTRTRRRPPRRECLRGSSPCHAPAGSRSGRPSKIQSHLPSLSQGSGARC